VFAFLVLGMSLAGVVLSAPNHGELRPLRPSEGELEDRVFEAINQERGRQGLPPLQRAGDLSAVARKHSRDMMARNYFAHQSPEGDDLRGRFARSGIGHWRVIAENIAYNSGYSDPVSVAVEGWMQSPGHRRNILDPRLQESGIGVAVDRTGRTYFTQVFATRRSGAVAHAW
jgi:uncharacterized protein YkwD